jgi:hypothetical protein
VHNIQNLLFNCGKLQRFTMNGISSVPSIVNTLSAIHSLTHLTVHPSTYGDALFEPLPTLHSFSLIETLDVSTNDGALRNLLNRQSPWVTVTDLTFWTTTIPNHEQLCCLTSSISSSCLSLHRLVFGIPLRAYKLPTTEHHIDITHIRPLFSLLRLKELCMEDVLPLKLFDEDVAAMATVWPEMHSLYLGQRPHFLNNPTLTLLSLVHLTSHPNLVNLGLYFYAAKPDSPLPDPLPSFKRLRHLFVGSSDITHHEVVAKILSAICPASNLTAGTSGSSTVASDPYSGRIGLCSQDFWIYREIMEGWAGVRRLYPPFFWRNLAPTIELRS